MPVCTGYTIHRSLYRHQSCKVIYTDAAYTSYHGLSCAVAALRVQLTGISFVYYLVYTIAEHDRWIAMYPTFVLDRVRAGVGAEAATG